MDKTARVSRIQALRQAKLTEDLATNVNLHPQHWKPAGLIRRIVNDRPTQALLSLKSSLTAKLKQTCPQLQVVVLSEAVEVPLPSEALRLALPMHEEAWIRCVLLKCDQHNWVYARTVIPFWQAQNPWHELQTLGDQPLGEVLFNMPNLTRSPFEFAKDPLVLWPHLSQNLPAGENSKAGFARRSVFIKEKMPLLLTEVFLPQLLADT